MYGVRLGRRLRKSWHGLPEHDTECVIQRKIKARNSVAIVFEVVDSFTHNNTLFIELQGLAGSATSFRGKSSVHTVYIIIIHIEHYSDHLNSKVLLEKSA